MNLENENDSSEAIDQRGISISWHFDNLIIRQNKSQCYSNFLGIYYIYLDGFYLH